MIVLYMNLLYMIYFNVAIIHHMQKNTKSMIKRVKKSITEKYRIIFQNITMRCIAQNFQMKYIMSMVSTQNE